MRLTNQQVKLIKCAVKEVVKEMPVHIWLFGSRVDDNKRGGDIDLFIETENDVKNRVETASRIYTKLIFALGDQKIDVLLKDIKTPESKVFKVARETGILL